MSFDNTLVCSIYFFKQRNNVDWSSKFYPFTLIPFSVVFKTLHFLTFYHCLTCNIFPILMGNFLIIWPKIHKIFRFLFVVVVVHFLLINFHWLMTMFKHLSSPKSFVFLLHVLIMKKKTFLISSILIYFVRL